MSGNFVKQWSNYGKETNKDMLQRKKSGLFFWFCDACTFKNGRDDLVCQMCGVDKPLVTAPSASTSSSSLAKPENADLNLEPSAIPAHLRAKPDPEPEPEPSATNTTLTVPLTSDETDSKENSDVEPSYTETSVTEVESSVTETVEDKPPVKAAKPKKGSLTPGVKPTTAKTTKSGASSATKPKKSPSTSGKAVSKSSSVSSSAKKSSVSTAADKPPKGYEPPGFGGQFGDLLRQAYEREKSEGKLSDVSQSTRSLNAESTADAESTPAVEADTSLPPYKDVVEELRELRNKVQTLERRVAELEDAQQGKLKDGPHTKVWKS